MNSGQKRLKRQKRHRRARAKAWGSSARPRLSVFRSNRHIHLQLIDDAAGKTLLSASSVNKKSKPGIEVAQEVGKELAEKALQQGIKKAVFDRGGYKYHGQVKAVAEAAREAGLKI